MFIVEYVNIIAKWLAGTHATRREREIADVCGQLLAKRS